MPNTGRMQGEDGAKLVMGHSSAPLGRASDPTMVPGPRLGAEGEGDGIQSLVGSGDRTQRPDSE